MNILILSAGTRDKIVQYFVNTLNGNGKVIAADMSNLAPAIYEADKYYIVPRMTDPGYLDVILDICGKEKVSGVLSLIDPELSLLAENKDRFEAIGVTVIGSSYELCEMFLINSVCSTGLKSTDTDVPNHISIRNNFIRTLRTVKSDIRCLLNRLRAVQALRFQRFMTGKRLGCYMNMKMV